MRSKADVQGERANEHRDAISDARPRGTGGLAGSNRWLRGVIRLADRHRYLLLSSILLLLMTSQTLNQQWSTDFWEHSAVVRALAADLLHPDHPLLPVDAPHPYFSPYTVAVGALARVLDIGPIGALSIAAVVNLALFLVAFWLFVGRLVASRTAPFYALVFALLLWGVRPWRWSGFLNLNSLGYGLPYPSMFATAVTLLSLWALLVYLDGGKPIWLLGPALGGAVVLLTHPITAVVAGIGAASLVLSRLDRRSRGMLPWLLVAAGGTVLLTMAWPYYRALDLLSQSSVYTSTHGPMYDLVLPRILPALVALPVIIQRMRRDWRDPLGLMLVGGAAVYGWGGLSGNLTYGRVISFVVLVLQIALGAWFADVELRLRGGSYEPWRAGVVYGGLAVLLLVGLVGVAPGLIRTMPRALLPNGLQSDARLAKVSDTYGFLGACTGRADVILTDLGFNSLVTPTFGGKVVATGYPLPFVGDVDRRTEDVERFFAPLATSADRRALLARYRVAYLLVNRAELDSLRVQRDLMDRLSVVHDQANLVLLATGAAPASACG
jgi:hypothetical protein